MGTRNRKPLSDITDFHNLTPLSVLRQLVSSNTPPLSIFTSNSNPKLGPESSDTIASSNSETLRFPNALTSPGDIGTKNAAYSRRNNIESSNKEREAQAIDSRTSIEKRRNKRKAADVPLSSSASEKMKENRSRICNMSVTDGVMTMQNAAYDQRKTIEKSRKERNSDLIGCHTPLTERKDKGKAIAMPYNTLPTGKLKEIQNSICNSSTLVERSCQKGEGNHSFSSGFAEDVKESNMDELVSYSHSSGKTEKGKANVSSSNAALGKQSEIGMDVADTSWFSFEKLNEKNKVILKHTRSSIVQLKDVEEDYLNPSTSFVGRAKDRPKFLNITNFLPEKTKGKGNVILEPSNIREASAAVAVISQPSRKMKTSARNNNAVGVSSCPTITRTKKLQNGLDEAENVKYLYSWTDPQANVRKKRPRTEKTSELPEEFIREQKAYFDDIDNFELPVEEVSQDESD
ncbi:hypothetical protein AAHA92_09646 [Salvia divinorum]|uniref:Sororin C-terminal region domain-containing protein n=1 Tax=Salvia divinorum TaxID=28513 RepID=A0ABD1HTR2_SALDI